MQGFVHAKQALYQLGYIPSPTGKKLFLPTISKMLYFFLYGCILPACVSVHHMCAVPVEARRGHRIPHKGR